MKSSYLILFELILCIHLRVQMYVETLTNKSKEEINFITIYPYTYDTPPFSALKNQHSKTKATHHPRKNSKKSILPFNHKSIRPSISGKTSGAKKNCLKELKGVSIYDMSQLASGGSTIHKMPFSHADIDRIDFLGSWVNADALPNLNTPEIALLGRSNVGKSSLLKSLFQIAPNHANVRVSKMPGCTGTINLYQVKNRSGKCLVTLTDLPGLGYASGIPKWNVSAIEYFIKSYIQKRNQIKLFCYLVDSRCCEPPEVDNQAIGFIKNLQIPILVIATKVDKCGTHDFNKNMEAYRNLWNLPDHMPIPITINSALNRNEIWNEIQGACMD